MIAATPPVVAPQSQRRPFSVPANRLDALNRARQLVPRIRGRAARAEAERRIPDETIRELHDAGLFHLVTPRTFGGAELGFSVLVEVTAELAAACGSTGWVYGVLTGHSWMLNLFPAQAQHDVFDDPAALTATVFRLGGEVRRVEGGYRLTGGAGRFCSGIDFASWVIVGNAVIAEGGKPEPRFFVVPRSEIEVVDDWFTAGMRGTGSRSIRIADTFIPQHRSIALQQMLDGTSPGAQFHNTPLYRLPFVHIAPFSIIGAPLGMARGALATYSEALTKKLAGAPDLLVAEQGATLSRLAEVAAGVDAAYALVLEDARRVDGVDGGQMLTPLEQARIPRDWAHAAQTSRYAVTRLFECSGGSGIYDSSELQRVWRDVNSAAQHVAFTWDTTMTGFGRAMLGLAPAAFSLRGR